MIEIDIGKKVEAFKKKVCERCDRMWICMECEVEDEYRKMIKELIKEIDNKYVKIIDKEREERHKKELEKEREIIERIRSIEKIVKD